MSKDPGQRLSRRAGGKRVWRWLRNAVLGAIAILLVFAAAGAVYQSVATARDARRFSPPGEMVDVGGFRLHLDIDMDDQHASPLRHERTRPL